MRYCSTCGGSVEPNSAYCIHCGVRLQGNPAGGASSYNTARPQQGNTPYSAPPFPPAPQVVTTPVNTRKINRRVAAILAILLGGVGAQYLYMKMPGRFVLCLICVATFMPVVLGVLQGVRIFCLSDADFKEIYLGYAPTEVAKDPTTIYL